MIAQLPSFKQSKTICFLLNVFNPTPYQTLAYARVWYETENERIRFDIASHNICFATYYVAQSLFTTLFLNRH